MRNKDQRPKFFQLFSSRGRKMFENESKLNLLCMNFYY